MATIHEALDKRQYCRVLLMLDKGSDVNVQDDQGRTVLMRSCALDDHKVACIIACRALKRGASRDVYDKKGRGALSHAVTHNRDRIAKMILARNDFNINHADTEGNTALHLSVKNSCFVITRLILATLIRYKLPVDVPNKEGLTPLMLACSQGDLQTARYLVHDCKASTTMRDDTFFKNAREWLETSLVISKNLDPFRKTLPIGIFSQKVEKPKPQNDSIKTNTVGLKARRVMSAGPRLGSNERTCSTRKHSDRPLTSNCFTQRSPQLLSYQDEPMVPASGLAKSDSFTNIFLQLYALYAIQSSNTYLPSAAPKPPSSQLLQKEGVFDVKGRRLSVRSRIQHVMRIKRAGSVFSNLRRNKSKSDFQRKLSMNSVKNIPLPENGVMKPLQRRVSAMSISESEPSRPSDTADRGDQSRPKRKLRRQPSSSSMASSNRSSVSGSNG